MEWHVDLASELARVPGISTIRVWYDARADFNYLAFSLDGHRYLIRSYKALCLIRDPDGDDRSRFWERYFYTAHGGRTELLTFFTLGRYKTCPWKLVE